MTTPRSFTSSRYTGAPARRSLERTSVVSIITSRPIHASGILSSESEAPGLSLSIMVLSSARFRPRLRIPPPNRGRAYFPETPRAEVRGAMPTRNGPGVGGDGAPGPAAHPYPTMPGRKQDEGRAFRDEDAASRAL